MTHASAKQPLASRAHAMARCSWLVLGLAWGLTQPAAAQLPGPAGFGASLTSEASPSQRLPASATVAVPPPFETAPAETAPSVRPSAALVPLDHPIDANEYVCGPGDSFDLQFWGQENFAMTLSVDLEGRLFVPKLGLFVAAGQTLADVRNAIRKKARAQYPGLTFDMSLRKPRTFVVHVSEDVKHPGPYEAHALQRVSQVLDQAGGKRSRRNVSIRRADGKEVHADLLLYERTGDTKYNPLLSDGDVIRVPPRVLVATIAGSVRYPGEYELVAGRDLAELVELAGGFLSSASHSLPMRLVRRDESERPVSQDLAWGAAGESPRLPLKDDDVITVRSTSELQRTVLLQGPVEGADALDGATSVRRLPYVEGDTVRSVIERAGGLKAPGDLKGAYISRRSAEGKNELIRVDLEALLAKRDFSADRPVLVGDEIVVPVVRRGVLVQGAVGRPGLYPFTANFGVPEFIAHAGGPTRMARSMNSVSLVRPNGKTQPYEPGVTVGPGDAIIVPERHFTRPEVVSMLIAAGGLLISGLTLALVVSK